jgi:hypothetical protein
MAGGRQRRGRGPGAYHPRMPEPFVDPLAFQCRVSVSAPE